MKRSLSLFAAVALGLAAAAQSRADTIPSISFQWINVVPVDLPASQWKDPTNHSLGTVTDQSGGAFFVPENGGPFLINQETQTAAASVILSTTASPSNPDQILKPASGSNYAVQLEVTRDYTVNGQTKTATADITFNSLLTGSMVGSYKDAVTGKTINAVAVLNNSVTGISVTGGTVLDKSAANGTVTVQIGDAQVKVDYLDFAPVEPNQHNPGTISFDITPSAAASTGPVGNPSPEPSSVVLGCMGLSCIGGVVWRARRRKAAEALKAAV